MKKLDFTMEKYEELCRVLLDAGYTPVTVHQYLTNPPGGKAVVLRHDIDRKPQNALKMSKSSTPSVSQLHTIFGTLRHLFRM